MQSPILKYGLLGGLVVVVYFIAVYSTGKTVFLNPFAQWFSMVFYLLFMVLATKADIKENGIQRDFRALSRTPFAVFLLINLCYWIFYYGLHLADNQLLELETAQQLAAMREELNAGTGDPVRANELREQIQQLENEGSHLPLGPVVLRMAMGALGGFAISIGIISWLKMKE